jgi:hypothetical protein
MDKAANQPTFQSTNKKATDNETTRNHRTSQSTNKKATAKSL